MEAVSCMARDNGYKLIIILSGHVTNLADQTKRRVYKSLDMYGWDRLEIERGKKINLQESNSKLKNILNSLNDRLRDENEKPSLLIVSMKQWQRIGNIISIFQNAKDNGLDLSKIPTLFIDDEADHYSLDTVRGKPKKNNSIDKNPSEYHVVKKKMYQRKH